MSSEENKHVAHTRKSNPKPLKERIFIIIFGTDTRLGKLFDIWLIILILLSVVAVLLESVSFIAEEYGTFLYTLEWLITGCFTVEYAARIWVVSKPKKYIFSFFGIIDFLSLVPTYLSVVIAGSQSLVILRAIRLLRIFRILKLVQFVSEAAMLLAALKRSRHKITVFFLSVLILVVIMGSAMHLVEGGEHGFNSIPRSIYWAIITLTTVGYGDLVPVTVAGQIIASLIMLLGYSIIAIPTGIVGAEIYSEVSRKSASASNEPPCGQCGETGNVLKARYCHNCGKKLHT